MRALAYILVALGIVFLLDAIRDEQSGVATVSSPTRTPIMHTVTKVDNPKLFEGAMFYQWSRAALFLAGGVIILSMFKRADRNDPFAESFDKSKAVDEWERSLAEEEKRFRRPFHIWKD